MKAFFQYLLENYPLTPATEVDPKHKTVRISPVDGALIASVNGFKQSWRIRYHDGDRVYLRAHGTYKTYTPIESMTIEEFGELIKRETESFFSEYEV